MSSDQEIRSLREQTCAKRGHHWETSYETGLRALGEMVYLYCTRCGLTDVIQEEPDKPEPKRGLWQWLTSR